MDFTMAAGGGNIFDIGAFDAKTYFSELLRKVQGGAIFNISKNGKKIAVLQGAQTARNTQALEAHKRILERSKRLRQIQESGNFEAITRAELKELKNAGRKY